MFGSSRPVVIDRYRSRRSGAGLPRWLWLLLFGIAVGAGAVLFVQQRYLPPRLSAAESTALRGSLEQAESEREQLRGNLAEATRQRVAAQADNTNLKAALDTSRADAKSLREAALILVDQLPPDPRGSTVGVRAANFDATGGLLNYDVVLTREGTQDKPLSATVRFVVAGTGAQGTQRSAELPPLTVSIGRFASVRGSLALPENFKPRQTTVNVTDANGQLLGKRVLYVK
ncbi:MAG: hypothetical protein ABIR94_07050 [Rubrivivax sp.]